MIVHEFIEVTKSDSVALMVASRRSFVGNMPDWPQCHRDRLPPDAVYDLKAYAMRHG